MPTRKRSILKFSDLTHSKTTRTTFRKRLIRRITRHAQTLIPNLNPRVLQDYRYAWIADVRDINKVKLTIFFIESWNRGDNTPFPVDNKQLFANKKFWGRYNRRMVDGTPMMEFEAYDTLDVETSINPENIAFELTFDASHLVTSKTWVDLAFSDFAVKF